MASTKYGYATFTTNSYPNGKFANPQGINLQGGVSFIAASTVIAITAWTRTGNTVVFTATNSLAVGNAIFLANFATTTGFNGVYVNVTAATGSTFTIVLPSNVSITATSGTENGNALVPSAKGVISITAWSITTNVATFTAANSLAAGDIVILSGFGTSTFFNGSSVTVISTGLSGTQFEANFTHADGSGTETGIATVQGSYPAGGFPCLWFPQTNGTTGNVEYPVVGPNFLTGSPAVPFSGSVLVKSQAAGIYSYNYDSTHNTIRLEVMSTGSEVAAQVVPTADTIAYSATFERV